MNNVHAVAMSDNGDNGTDERSGILFRVSATLNDGIEELTTSAEVHDKMDVLLVLVGVAEIGDVGVAFEMVHDLNFTLNIFDILRASELTLGNRFAGVVLGIPLGFSKAGGAELATTENFSEAVVGSNVLLL